MLAVAESTTLTRLPNGAATTTTIVLKRASHGDKLVFDVGLRSEGLDVCHDSEGLDVSSPRHRVRCLSPHSSPTAVGTAAMSRIGNTTTHSCTPGVVDAPLFVSGVVGGIGSIAPGFTAGTLFVCQGHVSH